MLSCDISAIIWQFEHPLALPFFGVGMKMDISSPVATVRLSKFAGILSSALSQQHLLQVKVNMLVTQLCSILCDPLDYNPPSSSVHGILQTRTLEWVAIPFFKGSSQPRAGVLHCRWILYWWRILSHQGSNISQDLKQLSWSIITSTCFARSNAL